MPAMESGVVMHPVNKLNAHGNPKHWIRGLSAFAGWAVLAHKRGGE